MSRVSSAVVSTNVAYTGVVCIKRERLATQHFVSITVDVHGLPVEVDEKEEIPLQITISVPEGFRDYVRPVIWAEASTIGMTQPDCKPETERSMDISFLPLPIGFDYQHDECWKVLVEQIAEWLVSTVADSSTPEWAWGQEAFWMAFIAAFPQFPAGEWPVWNPRIPMAGSFIQSWLDENLRNRNFGGSSIPLHDIWLQFQQHIAKLRVSNSLASHGTGFVTACTWAFQRHGGSGPIRCWVVLKSEMFSYAVQVTWKRYLPAFFFSSGVSRRVNTEGRARLGVPPPGASRENWKIIRALSGSLGSPLPYDDALALRDRMWEISPTLVRYDVTEGTSMEVALAGLDVVAKRTTGATVKSVPFERPIKNFYMTDAISRA
ncbi:hypothetical protein F5887DRAFT_1158668 [Amanita rubescens]|nr:hypothetical protein F5887DRAFT_1158668 [Amanita rubescens]